jgi:hypothetical protein
MFSRADVMAETAMFSGVAGHNDEPARVELLQLEVTASR